MLQTKYQRFCYLPTFYSNVVEDALWVGDADGGRLIDGEPVGDVIAHLVLDAAVAGLGSNAGGVAGTRIANAWRHKMVTLKASNQQQSESVQVRIPITFL